MSRVEGIFSFEHEKQIRFKYARSDTGQGFYLRFSTIREYHRRISAELSIFQKRIPEERRFHDSFFLKKKIDASSLGFDEFLKGKWEYPHRPTTPDEPRTESLLPKESGSRRKYDDIEILIVIERLEK